MAKTRQIGSTGRRVDDKGRPAQKGNPIGKGKGTRVVAQPRVTPIYTHCREKNKKGQPCKSPNVKGQPYCQGHLNKREAIRRRESAAT